MVRSFYRFSILGICFIVLFSCSDKQIVNNDTEVIRIEEDNLFKNIGIRDYCSNLKIIPLQTTRNSLFTRIDRLYIYDNKIYILSRNDQAILIFDDDGNFIRKINSQGKGPGEYIQIKDFTINTQTNELVIMADIPYKFLCYSLDGQFNNEISGNEDYFSISYYNGYYSLFKLFPTKKKADYRIYIKDDLNNSQHKKYLPFNIDSTFMGGTRGPYLNFSNSVMFSSSYTNNTIYSLDGEQITARYYIDFREKNLTKDLMKFPVSGSDRIVVLKDIRKSGSYYFISKIRDYKNSLIFAFLPQFYCVYDKINKSVKYSTFFYDEKLRMTLHKYFAHDGSDNNILFIVNPKNLRNILSNTNEEDLPDIFSTKDKKLMSIKRTDNPVLFIYTID